MALINASIYSHLKIHCALQIGYFKAKNVFFQIDWRDVSCEDLQFIIYHYFPNDDTPKIAVTKHEYYTQRKRIADFFSYKLWSKAFAPIFLKQAIQIIKRDTTANFIALELIAFLKNIKVIRPGYTTLQDIVSRSLANERIRIRDILNIELNPELRINLNDLMVNEDNISKLAALKQDAKNFGFKMMSKERQKYSILEPIYTAAKDIIKQLELSNQNIEYYAGLINYYEAWGLRNLQHNQNYLYILCYVFKRFQQINDNLIEAFIYHANKITHNIKVKTEINFADERINSQTKKIGRLLLLYVDEKFKDSNLFSRVRRRAFKIMPKEDIESYGQKMLNKSRNKKEFFWQEVDKAHKGCKKHLRPLFMKLGFSSESAANLWVHSVDLLQKTFAANKRLSKVALDECSNTILPKTVYSCLLENNTNGKNSINANRYEYWMYRQINKQISTGVLYVENSLSYRCFNHELVSMDKKETILESLSIPWLRQPIEKQLNNLINQLQDLWLTFDNYLKQGTLTHLQYDRKKQRLYCRKVSANKYDKLQSDFYDQLPFCEIDTILRFVDENCNYLSAFKPLQPRYAKGEWADKDKLIATILSQALKGLLKISK